MNILLFIIFSLQVNASNFGFQIVDQSYNKIEEEAKIVVPKIRSQDTLGMCPFFVAASAIDTANCLSMKMSQEQCSSQQAENKASPLDFSRFSNVENEMSTEEDYKRRSSFKGLKGMYAGGNAIEALKNALNVGGVYNEKCAPFVPKINGMSQEEQQETEKKIFDSLKASYEKYKNKNIENCAECLADITATAKELDEVFDVNIKADNAQILKAFAADTYAKFLDQLLVSGCKITDLVSLNEPHELKIFPLKDMSAKDIKSNYKETINQIKKLLKIPTGVIVNSYCAKSDNTKNSKECQGFFHSFMISGYRKICNTRNECRELVKVENSWGESWQRNNNDGWVSAEEVLSRTHYDKGSIGWLEPKHQ